MNNNKLGLGAAQDISNVVGFPHNRGTQPDGDEDLDLRIERAKERRENAQTETDSHDAILTALQDKYVILGEPAGIWDRNAGRLLKEQGFTFIGCGCVEIPGRERKLACGAWFSFLSIRIRLQTPQPVRSDLGGSYPNLK